MSAELGTFVRCYWVASGGSFTDFPEGAWDELYDAMQGIGPRVLDLTSAIGTRVAARADQIGTLMLSDPEGRKASYERDALWKDEERENTTRGYGFE